MEVEIILPAQMSVQESHDIALLLQHKVSIFCGALQEAACVTLNHNRHEQQHCQLEGQLQQLHIHCRWRLSQTWSGVRLSAGSSGSRVVQALLAEPRRHGVSDPVHTSLAAHIHVDYLKRQEPEHKVSAPYVDSCQGAASRCSSWPTASPARSGCLTSQQVSPCRILAVCTAGGAQFGLRHQGRLQTTSAGGGASAFDLRTALTQQSIWQPAEPSRLMSQGAFTESISTSPLFKPYQKTPNHLKCSLK